MNVPAELTEPQLRELEGVLRELESELRGTLGRAAEGAKPVELDQSSVGRISRIDALQAQHLAKASARNLELRLQQVTQALHLLSQEEYGFCRLCEEPIGYRRLRARPETPLCLRCQGAREKGR